MLAGASVSPAIVRQGLNPLAPRGQRPDARFHAVGNDQQRVVCEQRWQFRLVGLELLERRPDRRILVRSVLQLKQYQRQAVHEQHDVRPARVPVLAYRELIHRYPVVVFGSVEIHHPRLRPVDRAVRRAVLHRYPVHQQAMHGAVAPRELRALGPRQPAEGIRYRLGRQCGVEPQQRVAQTRIENHLRVVRAFGAGLAGRDLEAVPHRPAEALEPGEGGLFDDGFGEGAVHAFSQSARSGTACSPSPKLALVSPS